ncbi:hypothetical protein AGDE_14191 [Angomonas deanei]|uniref:Protein N-terminal glutamine amidohydrolase n=1 Tax=Angomonas deanei TaxID=59799 RepID=A0A7G2CK95_9TRYP|nr:hypothetical protein AGDE_14191 [Angomonas deanei]CAD2219497.1 N-terminal glutamine amidase, putative [Angomonas deanei]|eukprot:EPY21288.1 hypothetical protein AGDE_14191 [Angomonas deanei]
MEEKYKDLFDASYAVFVSSFSVEDGKEVKNRWETSRVPYRACKNKKNIAADIISWDYHVFSIFRRTTEEGARYYVVDFDSHCPRTTDEGLGDWARYGIDLTTYVQDTFLYDAKIPNLNILFIASLEGIRFRVLTAAEYLTWCRSDRSHMIAPKSKPPRYTAPPPSYPPILTSHPSSPPEELEKFRKAAEQYPKIFTETDGNNLVCFINMSNRTFPGVVCRRRELIPFFQSQK